MKRIGHLVILTLCTLAMTGCLGIPDQVIELDEKYSVEDSDSTTPGLLPLSEFDLPEQLTDNQDE